MGEKTKLDFRDTRKLLNIGKAFSAENRLKILEILQEESLNINEIAERMQIPSSSAAMHVKVLEEAGLIVTELMPGVRGSMKMCRKVTEGVEILLKRPCSPKNLVKVVSMPVGHYVDYQVEPTCGMVGLEGHLDEEDEPRCFYDPKRTRAELLWFGKGYVEYRFPNAGLVAERLERIELSMELCSEARDSDMCWASDITVWINGIEAGMWTCPSDFGDRRGKLNPSWWPDKNSQYGMLKTWTLDRDGTSLDGVKVTINGIERYGLVEKPYISVRIGVKDEAEHAGGVNLFGEGFGDYRQNILMKFYYKDLER